MYSLIHAEADLEATVEDRPALKAAILRGDIVAIEEIIPLAHDILEKVETRFLIAWAEDETMLDDRDDLIVNAAHRITDLVLHTYGWRTQLIRP